MSINPYFNPQTLAGKAILNIQKSIESFKSPKQTAKQSYYVIGDTGEGKSSLINYIAGNPLVAEKPNNKPFHIIAPNELDKIIIGSGAISVTAVPNKWVNEETGEIFWDCPGFGDTKGANQEIINGFNIMKVLEASHKAKFIIVVSQNSLQGRIDKFIGVLRTLQNMFIDLEKILDAFTLVVTRTANIQNVYGVKESYLKQIINDYSKTQGGLSENIKKLLNYFISKEGIIALFPAPKKSGPIETKSVEQIKKAIMSSIFVPSPKIKIPVGYESNIALQLFATTINAEVNTACISSNKILHQKCQNIIKECKSFEDAHTQLISIKENIKSIKDPSNVSEFITNWTQTGNTLNLNFQYGKVSSAINRLQFILSVKENVKLDLQMWQKNFTILQKLDKLTKQPDVQEKARGTLSIKSPLLGIRKLQTIISSKGKNNLKSVDVQCFHTLIIDHDLKCPGVSLFILSENIKLIGDRKINLKGLDGNPYTRSALSCNKQNKMQDGQDGLPGNPGSTGGNFFGKIMSKTGIMGSGKLTVDVRGGDGGVGQNGGDGKNGQKGDDAKNVREVEDRNKIYLVDRVQYNWSDKKTSEQVSQVFKTVGTFNSQMLETYRALGGKGQRGGNGGKKGAGGLPGDSGMVKLQGFEAMILSEKGKVGQQGKPGKAGIGGKNGYKFEGKYIQESILPAFRKKGSTIKQKKENENENTVKGQLLVQGGQLAVAIVAQQFAQQSAVQVAQSTLLTTTLGGLATFGVTLAVQTGLSLVSAICSSGWKIKPQFIDNGRAPSGQEFDQCSTKDQLKPLPTLSIQKSKLKEMESDYIKLKSIYL